MHRRALHSRRWKYFVNLDAQDAPDDLVSIRVEIPERIRVEQIAADRLAPGWRGTPYPIELQRIGQEWLSRGTSVCLLVPSAIIPVEQNLLLSPEHRDFGDLQFSEPVEFRFDPPLDTGKSLT